LKKIRTRKTSGKSSNLSSYEIKVPKNKYYKVNSRNRSLDEKTNSTKISISNQNKLTK